MLIQTSLFSLIRKQGCRWLTHENYFHQDKRQSAWTVITPWRNSTLKCLCVVCRAQLNLRLWYVFYAVESIEINWDLKIQSMKTRSGKLSLAMRITWFQTIDKAIMRQYSYKTFGFTAKNILQQYKYNRYRHARYSSQTTYTIYSR